MKALLIWIRYPFCFGIMNTKLFYFALLLRHFTLRTLINSTATSANYADSSQGPLCSYVFGTAQNKCNKQRTSPIALFFETYPALNLPSSPPPNPNPNHHSLTNHSSALHFHHPKLHLFMKLTHTSSIPTHKCATNHVFQSPKK